MAPLFHTAAATDRRAAHKTLAAPRSFFSSPEQLVSAALGSRLGKSPDLSRLDISVDGDETVPVPDLGGKPVPER